MPPFRQFNNRPQHTWPLTKWLRYLLIGFTFLALHLESSTFSVVARWHFSAEICQSSSVPWSVEKTLVLIGIGTNNNHPQQNKRKKRLLMIQWTDCSPICSCSWCSLIASCCINSSVQNRPKSLYPVPWLWQTVISHSNRWDWELCWWCFKSCENDGHFWPQVKATLMSLVSDSCLNFIPRRERFLTLAWKWILTRNPGRFVSSQTSVDHYSKRSEAETTWGTICLQSRGNCLHGRNCIISHIAVASCRNHMAGNQSTSVWCMLTHREGRSGSHLGWFDDKKKIKKIDGR